MSEVRGREGAKRVRWGEVEEEGEVGEWRRKRRWEMG